MATVQSDARYQVVHMPDVEGVQCSCGLSRRALIGWDQVPFQVNLTDISVDAVSHHHEKMFEAYYVVSAAPNARVELDHFARCAPEDTFVLLKPGCQHRGLGNLQVLVFALPKALHGKDESKEFLPMTQDDPRYQLLNLAAGERLPIDHPWPVLIYYDQYRSGIPLIQSCHYQVYFVTACGQGAVIWIDGNTFPVQPYTLLAFTPGCRFKSENGMTFVRVVLHSEWKQRLKAMQIV